MSVGAFDRVVKPSVETTMCFSDPRIADEIQNESTEISYHSEGKFYTLRYVTALLAGPLPCSNTSGGLASFLTAMSKSSILPGLMNCG